VSRGGGVGVRGVENILKVSCRIAETKREKRTNKEEDVDPFEEEGQSPSSTLRRRDQPGRRPKF